MELLQHVLVVGLFVAAIIGSPVALILLVPAGVWGDIPRSGWRTTPLTAIPNRERDARMNEEYRIPDGDSVEVPALWLVQAFLPPQVPAFLDALRNYPPPELRRPTIGESSDQWLEQVRQTRGGGWMSHGSIGRRGSERWPLSDSRVDDLPEGIEWAQLRVAVPVPSLILLLCEFRFDPQSSREPERILNTDYESDGWKWPNQLRSDTIEAWYHTTESRLWDWVVTRFGGLSDGGDPARTSLRFIVTSEAEPFPADRQGHPLYLRALGVDFGIGTWVAKDIAGLKLGNHYWDGRSILAASAAQFLPDDDMQGYGGRDAQSFASRVSEEVSAFLQLYALDQVVRRLSNDVAVLRDDIAAVLEQGAHHNEVAALQSRALRLSTDLIALAGDLDSSDRWAFFMLHDSPTFVSTRTEDRLFEDVGARLTTDVQGLRATLVALESVTSTTSATLLARA